MARSKRLHSVQFTGSMEQNDSSATIDTTALYIDRELSNQFGKNIRNGMKYRISGYSFAVRPKDTGASDDYDIGGALTGQLEYVPVNAHTTKAWGMGYDMFMKQKRLMGRVGQSTRYDDFEVAHSIGYTDSRTSIIDDNPLAVTHGGSGSGDGHRVGFYGDSHDVNNLTSLADIYNSRFTPPVASTSHYGTTIKSPKFGTTFIQQAAGESIWMTAHSSAGASGGGGVIGAVYSLPTGYADNVMFDGHLPILTGSMLFKLQWNPPDTATATEDDLYWSLTLFLDGWSAIPKLNAPKSKKGKKASSGKGKRRSSGGRKRS